MITVTSRTAARAVMILAGGVLLGLGVLAAVTNRVTGHEALGGFTAFLICLGAALALRRQNRRQS